MGSGSDSRLPTRAVRRRAASSTPSRVGGDARGAHVGRGPMLLMIMVLSLLAAPAGASSTRAAQDAMSSEPSAHQLLERAFRNLYDADFVQVLQITSRSRTGRELTRRLQITRKQTNGSGRALVRFLDPPDLRGTSLLVFQRRDRHDDVFLYLPAFERTRRISSAQRSDAFFGTDFTYEDLEPKQAKSYTARSLGIELTSDGRRIRLVEARPRSTGDSQYDRTIYAIDPETHVVRLTEYFRQDSLWKRLETDISSVEEVDGRHLPFRAKMSNVRRGTQTLIETESYEIRGGIPDSLFTQTNLAVGDDVRDRSRSAPPSTRDLR